ncbi:hypothetical protein LshimejAT787_1200890 [Lyophyllum shimeji]|uniref:Uncharacterized protein n=1 Tax=Lyophyllum shimeji TaxID=47721 RepID=A0A9P3USM2_LYOSH|nr:hypothetical protein LshimejAT787_1200890 [Lyophyllum shimeji]
MRSATTTSPLSLCLLPTSSSHPTPSPAPPPPVLKECHVNAYIVDVHSYVTISQKFHNPSNQAANNLTYTFSVLAGAAVCNFELVRASGKKVIGVVKEKDQAQKELNAAIAAGHTAALGEEQTKDVFAITVGNMAAGETVTVNLSYINVLIDDDIVPGPNGTKLHQLRFVLPRAYLQRWGGPPTAKITSGVKHENVPFTMDVTIQQAGRIYNVLGAAAQLGRHPAGHFDETFASVHIERKNTSTKLTDIVLAIEAAGLDKPRAFIEPHPSPDRSSTAIALSYMPTKPINSPFGMEFIALVDRSGSMGGVKLEMVKSALKTLVKSLPTKNTTINVFSFGSKVGSLWPSSNSYDDVSVDKANAYIDAMKPDYGTTDIPKGLDAVFNSLPSPLVRPVSIFLLTDGGAWDVKACMDKTEAAIRQRSTEKNFMRVFTVGLGDGVSTEACDGIARAGGGTSVYIRSAEEKFLGKCARLVAAARMVPVKNLKVQWERSPDGPSPPGSGDGCEGGEGATGPVSLSGSSFQFPTDVGPQTRSRQAPSKFPDFLPGTRLHAYAIVPKSTAVTKSLKITGFIPAINRPYEETIPIIPMLHSYQNRFLHTCAAKAFIQELEDGARTGMSAQEMKDEIIYYGTTFGLTSRHTSFLAVDNDQPTPRPVGLGHDIFTMFAVAPPPKAAAFAAPVARNIEFMVQSFAVDIGGAAQADAGNGDATIAASKDVGDEGDVPLTEADPAVLVELANLQSVNGGFGTKAADVLQLLFPRCGVTAQPVLEKYNIVDGEVLAALLAWAWMALGCGDEADGMKAKADAWLQENVKGVDVNALQRELCEVIKFEFA